LKPRIKVAFASGTEELNVRLIERMREEFPELPLYVVSEFAPEAPGVQWVRYYARRSLRENLSHCRAAFRGKSVRLAGVLLVPNVPFRRMRLLALLLAPLWLLAVNENLNDFMLRPRSLPTIFRHLIWRSRNWLRWHFGRHGTVAQRDWRGAWLALLAQAAGLVRRPGIPAPLDERTTEPGISLVIPSRNGKELLAAQLPGIVRELPSPAEIIVVDNGSDDGTADWLHMFWPQVKLELSPTPLSFAEAVNRGIARSQCSHVCLLNNDMVLGHGFFTALTEAFDRVPDLFCATAQIQFPAGVRREETGKAVMRQLSATDFPIRCEEPAEGENLTYVLYGSGGCSLYDAAKLRALGGVNAIYAPAYVEDLDLGYRAWQRGWPSVYVGGAVVEHRHRSTTSRYYSEGELTAMLERNYLQFLARSVADPRLFRRLWAQAVDRLRLRRYYAMLREAPGISAHVGGLHAQGRPAISEEMFLALTDGSVRVFPGRRVSDHARVVIASPYLPFPLAHGGAVRMYNLMRRSADSFDEVLVAFSENDDPPAEELLDICVEVVLVKRAGSHLLPSEGRPEVVEEFSSRSFSAALRQTVKKWAPAIAQLEFTQMGQYAADCAPARTILVEHDVTIDLYRQLLAMEDDWEMRRQLVLWRRFETQVWHEVSCVVTMSEKDRRMISADNAVSLPNGVDLARFQAAVGEPEQGRLLFIGSFAHLPNLLAAEFFLNQVWPLLHDAQLHIIAGANYEYFLARYKERVELDLARERVEVEGFVADVRPAYRRAALVVAPLVASAGTNIKVLEAMAMGRAVVSTPAGVNGLDLAPGEDFVLVKTAEEMAAAIEELLSDPIKRNRIEWAARARVERDFGWDEIGRQQVELYREIV
jgi:GT2 family glycosyltransferase/glycosyltransferase involved in cell wall biosynthesis